MDYALFRLINGLAGRSPPADELMRLLATDYMVPTTAMSLLVWLWFSGERGRQHHVLMALVAFVAANMVVKAMNLVYFRPRPFTNDDVTLLFYHPSDSSFPANSAAALWSLAWAIWRLDPKLGRWLVVLALLMGISRIYVGVHYPLDIVGGALIGIGCARWSVSRAGPRLEMVFDRLISTLRRLAIA
ncbi:MAG: phosphatase PAP2 family protein [Ardenticatenia bacterium]|nr:phosphatase PAP2 family protein [Ardenticatenia bacterium]